MQSEDESVIEYDSWRWHTEGAFPKDQLPEQGYVHIGVFLTWLINHDMLDPDWIAGSGVKRAVAAIRERQETTCALRDMTGGRFTSDMLTVEGRGFTGAYYARSTAIRGTGVGSSAGRPTDMRCRTSGKRTTASSRSSNTA